MLANFLSEFLFVERTNKRYEEGIKKVLEKKFFSKHNFKDDARNA
jgi:hypothetical protein